MTPQGSDSAAPDAMARLLDQVHQALTGADYPALGPLTVQIEEEMARLEAGTDSATLRGLQAQALRNARCLQAATQGFRAARRRVEEIRAARSGLVTYGPKGRRAEVHPTGDLVKRF